MLLNMKKFTLFLLVISSFSAFAQKAEFLTAGKYSLIDGDKMLCANFELLNSEVGASSISFSDLYNFQLKNSKHLVESDIDPDCQFKEVNKIENKSDRTVLIRTNEEICKGKLRSKTISEAEITHQDIKLHHQVDGAEIKCHWKK